jgi:acrylyl-CoA reductase (NADPH)
MPFILRGVTLVGIDSVYRPKADRVEAWERLGRDLDVARLDAIMQEIPLQSVIETASAQLEGRVRGRVVVNVNS